MNIFQKFSAKDKSTGIYLTLEPQNEGKCFCDIKQDGFFRKHATVFMPDVDKEKQFGFLVQIIVSLESGCHWPVRIEWENIKRFFSMKDLQRLEGIFPLVPFYLYNAAEVDKRKIDIDAIYHAVKWRKEVQQKANRALQE